MKSQLISTLCSLCVSFAAACQTSTIAPPRTGIEFEMSSSSAGALEPDGMLRVEGLDRDVSAHVPATPLDPSTRTQRVELPPGSYSVYYLPVELQSSLTTIRTRASAKVVSQNPFHVVVSDGRFTKVRIRAIDRADAELTRRARGGESALVR